jgi:transposase
MEARIVKNDARSLSPDAQEAIRFRAVQAALSGMSQVEVARIFNVARGTVAKWIKFYHKHGETGLAAKPQGRPSEPQIKVEQAQAIVDLICMNCPDELHLPYTLWTREAVCFLIERHCGSKVSVWTSGRYLKSWGLFPQKPVRRAFEQDPKAVEQWLKVEYPSLQAEAKKKGAEIHWADEMGLRSDYQTGRSWGLKAKTPVIHGTGKRFGCNMISSITNRGTLRFKVFCDRFTTDVFIDFLKRLIRTVERKVYLIVDRHPVHRAKRVRKWLDKNKEKIKMFFLPAYSPDLNPDEFLNHDRQMLWAEGVPGISKK